MSTENLIYKESRSIQCSLGETGIQISEQSASAFEDEINNEGISSYFSCLGSRTFGDIKGHTIPYSTILWSKSQDESEDLIELTFAVKHHGTLKIRKQIFEIHDFSHNTSRLSDEILKRSYAHSSPQPSILALVNPFGGKGNALETLETKIKPVLEAANAKVTYVKTEYKRHAQKIAKELNIEDYDIIACCSGDGIPHEVINGFYEKENHGFDAFEKIALAQLPCGTGNALSLSTFGTNDASLCALSMLKSKRSKMDLMSVTQPFGTEEVTKLSFLSQCFGVIADCDIGTESTRWLGPLRFEIGVAHRVLTKKQYPCDLYVKYAVQSKSDLPRHISEKLNEDRPQKNLSKSKISLSGPSLDNDVPEDWVHVSSKDTSKLGIFYVGKMPYVTEGAQFFPTALPDDGTMDMIVTSTNDSVIELTSALLAVDTGGHLSKNVIEYSKISSYRLVPKGSKKNYISIDGEEFPCKPFQVEIIPRLLTFLSETGRFVDTSMTRP